MMTKRQFALMIVDEFIRDNGIKLTDRNDLSVLSDYILSSSSLAVALEYLNAIRDETLKQYTASRGGAQYIYTDKSNGNIDIAILSTREIIELLPETIEE